MGAFRMPSLGADMDVGTIIEWLVKPGDTVRRGQIVAVVDTAKAAIEIEVFEEGVISEILVRTGLQVPVGTPLAMIGPTQAAPPVAAATPHPALVVDSDVPNAGIDDQPKDGHPRAAPPVRHLAHQLGVDLDAIRGTAPDGHITHDDVLRAAPAARRLPDRSGFPTVRAPQFRIDPESGRAKADRSVGEPEAGSGCGLLRGLGGSLPIGGSTWRALPRPDLPTWWWAPTWNVSQRRGRGPQVARPPRRLAPDQGCPGQTPVLRG